MRLATARGGLHGGASPERARTASGVRYRLRQLAQKYGGTLGALTVLWIEGKAGAVCSATRVGGGGGTELASGVEGGVRRAPGRLRSTRGAPAVRPGAQGDPELNGGEQLLKSESSPAWRSAAERDGGGARVYGGDCEARWGVGGPRGLLIGRRRST